MAFNFEVKVYSFSILLTILYLLSDTNILSRLNVIDKNGFNSFAFSEDGYSIEEHVFPKSDLDAAVKHLAKHFGTTNYFDKDGGDACSFLDVSFKNFRRKGGKVPFYFLSISESNYIVNHFIS